MGIKMSMNAQLIFKHMSPKDYVYHNKYYIFIII